MSKAPIVGFHLDLKYIMPNKAYLTGPWLDHLAELGVNTLLIEYEDKFPWAKHPFIQAEGAFTSDELRKFLVRARQLGIQCIPLVQTLAHLEFALSHDELAHLREMPDIFTHICPANPQAIQFVHDMIDEVLAYHQDDEMFHLGADEAHYTGTNPLTKPKLEQLGKVGYWVDHLAQFIERVKKAGKRPVVWDDIFWPDPAAITRTDLPKDVVLHCWDYVIRRKIDREEYCIFNPSGGTNQDFGSNQAYSKFRDRVATYRKAGYEILGGPCLNWGVLTPQHDHCLENTAAWEGIARDVGALGMINTAWQSFHTMLPTYWTWIAGTSQLVTSATGHLKPDWEAKFLAEEFGTNAADVPAALEDLGTLWEQRVEGLNRPITPVVYGYMDMILYWPTADHRAKRSAYPRDWHDVDFTDIFNKKMKLLRDNSDHAVVRSKVDDLDARFKHADAVLANLAFNATRHRDEAALLATFARLKLMYVSLVRNELFGEGDRDDIAAGFAAMYPELSRRIAPFVEPASHDRLMRVWCEPPGKLLVAAS